MNSESHTKGVIGCLNPAEQFSYTESTEWGSFLKEEDDQVKKNSAKFFLLKIMYKKRFKTLSLGGRVGQQNLRGVGKQIESFRFGATPIFWSRLRLGTIRRWFFQY